MKLPWSSGVYKDDKRYYPQDRVFCDGSVFASLAEQTGNRPSFTVNPDGTYEVSSGWMLLAPGVSGSSDGIDYTDLANKPKINGVELVGDKSAAAFGLAEKSDIPDTSGLASKSEIPAKTSQLVNDSGFATRTDIDEAVAGKVDKVEGKGLSTNDYTDEEKAKVASALQSYTETDPTVPEWAKRPTKPEYTAEEVGALPEGTKIPSKTSELSNDSGFATKAEVEEMIAAAVTAAINTEI